MIITDAQIHIWGPDVPERPWRPSQCAEGAESTAFEAPRIIAEMDAAGVDRAVLVPHGERNGLDPAGINDLGLQATRDYPGRFGVMGVISDIDVPGSVDPEHWLDAPGMLGVRIANRQTSQGVLAEGRTDWFFEGAARYGIPVMIYAPGRTEEVDVIAARFPQVRIMLDHLNIGAPRGADLSSQVDDVISLAAHQNVAAKISALPRLVLDGWPYRSVQPHVKRVVEAFGAERCIWGSDLSGLGVPYVDWVRAITEDFGFLDAAQKELVLGGALAQWLDWPATATVGA